MRSQPCNTPDNLQTTYSIQNRILPLYHCPCSRFFITKTGKGSVRLTLGLRNSTPNNISLAEAQLPPLITRAEYQRSTHPIRIIANPNHFLNRYTEAYFNSVNALKPWIRHPSCLLTKIIKQTWLLKPLLADNIEYWFGTYQRSFLTSDTLDTTIGHVLEQSTNINDKFQEVLSHKYASHIPIFTDSKTQGGISTGAAWIRLELGIAESISIRPQTSVFTAECLAISRALDIIRDHLSISFIICIDSLTCLSALQNPNRKHSHKYIEDITQKITRLCRLVSIQYKPKIM
ncbi:hypothetical protein ANTQUA_LOCUS2220 [Anthophora quadrimaculata]